MDKSIKVDPKAIYSSVWHNSNIQIIVVIKSSNAFVMNNGQTLTVLTKIQQLVL